MSQKPVNLLQVLDYKESLSMTSLEISELTGARHDKVKQSIERLANRTVIELPPVGEIKTLTKPTKVYIFTGPKGKRDTLVVIAQMSPEFTATLVDRWEELEKENLSLLQETVNAEVTILRANAANSDLERQQLLQQHLDSTNALQRAETRLEQYRERVIRLESTVVDKENILKESGRWIAEADELLRLQRHRIKSLKTALAGAKSGYNDLLYSEYFSRFGKWKHPFTLKPSNTRVQTMIRTGWLYPCGTAATPIGRYLVDVRQSDKEGHYSYSYSEIGHRFAGQHAKSFAPMLADVLVKLPVHRKADLSVLGITEDDLDIAYGR